MSSPIQMNYTNQIKERAHLVFIKITENIFEVYKDRKGKYTGTKYINSEEVLNSLNQGMKVVLFTKRNELIHKTF